MTTKSKSIGSKIDAQMDAASKALQEGRYFEAERLSRDALEKAHQAEDYERMARITLPLQEARRQKRLLAVDTDRIFRMNEMDEEAALEAGMYLIEPMLVGAHGRDLRDRADSMEVPVLVVVREPQTRMGLWPIVMIGPVTVRTQVRPPAGDKPDAAWMTATSEALGDAALEMSTGRDAADYVDVLMDALGTIGDHERLIQELANACRAALDEIHAAAASD